MCTLAITFYNSLTHMVVAEPADVFTRKTQMKRINKMQTKSILGTWKTAETSIQIQLDSEHQQ